MDAFDVKSTSLDFSRTVDFLLEIYKNQIGCIRIISIAIHEMFMYGSK